MPAKIKDPQKYFPFPLLKLGALHRRQGDNVALVLGNRQQTVPFRPDKILVTTVFSWWFPYVTSCVEHYHAAYPDAQIRIGGVHASISPELYRSTFPYADVHEGPVPEAEEVEPAWDLLPRKHNLQILRFSSGCIRSCSFCSASMEPYVAFDWDQVAKKIRFRRLVLNDNNFLGHPAARDILKNLAEFRFCNGDSLSSIEIQGGLDCRLLYRQLDFIPLLKNARVKNIRLAWDGDMAMLPMIEACLVELEKNGYGRRNVRCYMLYNHDLPFRTIIEKLRHFERLRVGPIHSRYRPISLLHDGYVPQKRSQSDGDYYVHSGWTDGMIRVVGSIASDISRMVRANVPSVDDVRLYYKRPTVEQTLEALAA
jgi:hypothetical protein